MPGRTAASSASTATCPTIISCQHLTWKTLDGLKDFTAFHMGRVSDNMQISDHGAKVVLANCQRCHAETISRINEDRRCWDCHRRLSHKRTGAIETRTP